MLSGDLGEADRSRCCQALMTSRAWVTTCFMTRRSSLARHWASTTACTMVTGTCPKLKSKSGEERISTVKLFFSVISYKSYERYSGCKLEMWRNVARWKCCTYIYAYFIRKCLNWHIKSWQISSVWERS